MSRWFPSKGYRPNTSAIKVFVRYRCGIESKVAYPIDRQRWDWTGHDFDIMAWSAEEERKDEAA